MKMGDRGLVEAGGTDGCADGAEPSAARSAHGGKCPTHPRWRHERFGAIVALDEPPVLAYVDQDLATELGIPASPLWSAPAQAALEAPTEAHLTVTKRCNLACTHCYQDSTPAAGDTDLTLAEWLPRLDALARARVFHVAIGGGEALTRADLIAIAEAARARGITPNLTTNGAFITADVARRIAPLFGQINVSVDVLPPRTVFGADKATSGMRAAAHLVRAGARVGVNFVVARANFDAIEDVIAWAAEGGLVEVELLRLKPTGRARTRYLEERLLRPQRERLFPLALELASRYGVPIKLDCSAAPFVACHGPDKERMELFEVAGCIGGLSLLGVDERGQTSACSFYPGHGDDLLELEQSWRDAPAYRPFRDYVARAAEPCRSCAYLTTCRGGCRAVALFLTGREDAPDPECPRVEDAARG
jgi:radical SAM protein with 4Fe4S-binding SPASM domain